MNKYGSRSKFFRARNCLEKGPLAPPADFSFIPGVDSVAQLLTPQVSTLNNAGSFYIKEIGVFANFADGFVFKDSRFRLQVGILINAYASALAPLTGLIQPDITSKTVNGVGTAFLTELVPGDVIKYGPPTSFNYLIVSTVVNDAQITVNDYPYYGTTPPAGIAATKLNSLVAPPIVPFFDISELNYMYELGHFFNPVSFGVSGITDIILIAGFLVQSNAAGAPQSVTFLTKSIDPVFTDNVFLDIVVNVEYTG